MHAERDLMRGGLAIVAAAALCSPATAHDAERGWTYPLSCCSDYDCREVGDANTPDAAIRVFEGPEGYVISSTGETIPMTSKKVRHSPDGRFHWCSVAGSMVGKTICLFVPPMGF